MRGWPHSGFGAHRIGAAGGRRPRGHRAADAVHHPLPAEPVAADSRDEDGAGDLSGGEGRLPGVSRSARRGAGGGDEAEFPGAPGVGVFGGVHAAHSAEGRAPDSLLRLVLEQGSRHEAEGGGSASGGTGWASVVGLAAEPTAARGRCDQTWAMLIKRVYEVDPLACPQCGGTMKVIAFIEPPQGTVIEKILRHCGLWRESLPRPPPADEEVVYVPDEDFPPLRFGQADAVLGAARGIDLRGHGHVLGDVLNFPTGVCVDGVRGSGTGRESRSKRRAGAESSLGPGDLGERGWEAPRRPWPPCRFPSP